MKHFLLLLLPVLLAGSAPAAPVRPAASGATVPPARTTDTVYVCMSKTSYAYHATNDCAGLNRCSHEVKAMSAADAQKLGKRACQKCH